MLTETLITIFKRDLERLKAEINLYQKEADLWLTTDLVSNSAGNLCLHIIGNLNHFIGAEFGNTGYVRQRDLEFSLKDISRVELLNKIDNVKSVVEKALKQASTEDLQKEYRHSVFENTMTTEFFLVHLTTHLTYHLGQINYHRRLLE